MGRHEVAPVVCSRLPACSCDNCRTFAAIRGLSDLAAGR